MTDGPDGMLAYQLAIENPSKDDPNWPLPSFDAVDWAVSFINTFGADRRPEINEDLMRSWFANALMRGYDEHARGIAKSRGTLASAIDAVLLAGQAQRDWLDRNPHPPLDASLAEAVAFYGGPRAALSLWQMVRAVEGLRGVVSDDGGG